MFDAIIVSDIHLGSPCCEAHLFLDFLNHLPETSLFVIAGDLLEGENYSLGLQEIVILKKILKIAKKTRVFWVEGNHDNWAREIQDSLKGVVADREFIEETESAELYITHGDQWDNYLQKHPLQTEVGAYLHNFVGKFSRPLAGWLKRQCKGYTDAVKQVKDAAIQWAYENMTVGGDVKPAIVICGHTHSPEVDNLSHLSYANAGSWTEGVGCYLSVQDGKVQLNQWK